MNYLIQKILVAVTLFLLLNTHLYARNFVVGISPNITSSDTERVFKRVTQFLLENVHLGDTVVLYDAYHNKLLGTFEVPNKSAYDHPKPKAKYNKRVLMRLKAFLNTKTISSNTPSNIASIIRFPNFTSFIGENGKNKGVTDVILIGNPLYVDFKEASFSMTGGFFPSDGHINASVNKSIYGTKERKDLLKGIRMHFAYRDVSWHNDLHQQMIKRFWSLYVSAQGGSLVTFTSDLDTVITRATDKDATNRRTYDFDRTDNKLEMLSVKREINRRHVKEVFQKEVSVPVNTLRSYVGKALVGIKWDCRTCDLDLYARTQEGNSFLFYGNTSSPEGTYHKDYLGSPAPVNGLEYIQFNNEIDVSKLLLAVNFYNGQSSNGPKGEIRVELNGAVYAKTFHIRASNGNKGKRAVQMNNDTHWVVIDPMDIVFGR